MPEVFSLASGEKLQSEFFSPLRDSPSLLRRSMFCRPQREKNLWHPGYATVRYNLNNLLFIQIKRRHYHCYHIQKFPYYLRSTPFPVGPKPLTNTEKPCKNSYKCLPNLRCLHSQVINALRAKLNILILHFSMKRENQTILDKRPWDT